MSESHRVAQGRSLAFLVQIRDGRGEPVAGAYDGSEPLSLELWPGDDREAIALPGSSVGWGGTDREGTDYSAADGVVTVTLAADDTATLEPGGYTLALAVTDGGEPFEVYRATLRVEARPGSAEPRPVYCSLRDLEDACPWIGDLAHLDRDQAGFAEARAWARQQVDRLALARAESRLADQLRLHGPVSYVEPIAIVAGVDAGPSYGPSVYPDTALRDQLDGIRSYLADDRLIVADDVRSACAELALWRILRHQVGESPEGRPFREFAAECRAEGHRVLRSITLRLDTSDPADGVADLEL